MHVYSSKENRRKSDEEKERKKDTCFEILNIEHPFKPLEVLSYKMSETHFLNLQVGNLPTRKLGQVYPYAVIKVF